MAFCTVLEWDSAFPLDRYQQMNDRAQGHNAARGLPEPDRGKPRRRGGDHRGLALDR